MPESSLFLHESMPTPGEPGVGIDSCRNSPKVSFDELSRVASLVG